MELDWLRLVLVQDQWPDLQVDMVGLVFQILIGFHAQSDERDLKQTDQELGLVEVSVVQQMVVQLAFFSDMAGKDCLAEDMVETDGHTDLAETLLQQSKYRGPKRQGQPEF
jgi:hypothetical protein